MRGQAGFWEVDERYALLSEAGDSLVELKEVVPWEVFRKPLAKALKQSDGAWGGRPRFDPVTIPLSICFIRNCVRGNGFKVLVLQTLHDLSNYRAEFLINDQILYVRFLPPK